MLTPGGVQQALEGLLVALVKVDMEGGHAVGVGHEQRPGVLVTPLMALLFVGRCARTGSATISLEYSDESLQTVGECWERGEVRGEGGEERRGIS